MASCRKLYEYSYFIEEIRKDLRTGLRLTQAVDRAMERCISEGILEDFLSIHRAEVKNVILEEYDEELHIKSEKKLSYDEGELANARAYILRLLELRGAVPDDLKERIQAETDIETLNQWFLLSAKAASVDEFRKKAAI